MTTIDVYFPSEGEPVTVSARIPTNILKTVTAVQKKYKLPDRQVAISLMLKLSGIVLERMNMIDDPEVVKTIRANFRQESLIDYFEQLPADELKVILESVASVHEGKVSDMIKKARANHA